MIYCRKCGNEINENYSHCGYCGDDRNTAFDPDAKKVKVASALAYLGILFFLPLAICPDSKKGRFHANQGLVLFIMNVVVTLISLLLMAVFTYMIISQASLYEVDSYPILIVGIIGDVIVYFALLGIGIFFLVLEILGIINGAKGIEKKLPLIGRFNILK